MRATTIDMNGQASLGSLSQRGHVAGQAGTVETLIWPSEYDWIRDICRLPANRSPVFRFPDLISACIAMVCDRPGGGEEVFQRLGLDVAMRAVPSSRHRTHIWRPQYEQLLGLQRSPANAFPNPRFQLDQFTTACVAIIRQEVPAGDQVYQQARQNLQQRLGGSSLVASVRQTER